MSRKLSICLVALVAAASASLAASATNITGAGSSFVYPVMSKWSATYAEKTGHRVNYQSIGSGGGIAQIRAGTVDFGASDKPLSSEDLDKYRLGQFPIVIGGIVPVVHIAGVGDNQLALDGPTLAAIFLGTIERWNNPAIAQLNPDLDLPDSKIHVVHRSDGSGTTFNFSNYLSKVSPAWKARVGEGTAVKWPTGIGGKGNEGVAAYVGQLKNSIGYVEYAYAQKNTITSALLKNAAGRIVKPGKDSFQAAAATVDWARARDFNLIMTNAPAANAWPITATTWVIMRRQSGNSKRSKVAVDFFRWSLEHGQAQAELLDYVPLPDSLVQQIETYWADRFRQGPSD